jgi:glycosyltransferase involved in cell wall biosynthesis
MRILYITERLPYPLDNGGNVRSYHILEGLTAEQEVTVVSGSQGEVSQLDVNAINALGAQVFIIPLQKRSLAFELRAAFQSIISRQSLMLARHFDQGMLCSLMEILNSQSRKFDAIHFNHLDAAIYASKLPIGPYRVVDQHNVVSRQLRTTIPSERSMLKRFAMQTDLGPLIREERAICNSMDLCLTCSFNDADVLRELGVHRPIVVVPNGVDTKYFGGSWAPQRKATEVIFVGTLDYQPCEVAVWDFATEILPLLRKAVPEVCFVVVGRNPSHRLKQLAERDRFIELTGRVEDVRPFMERARVVVVPLKGGSGTRLKILEALSIGVPVVTTTIGVEGIEAVDGKHLLIADSTIDFAASVRKLIEDPALAQRIGDAGRDLVRGKYSWHAAQLALRAAYQSLPVAASELPKPIPV